MLFWEFHGNFQPTMLGNSGSNSKMGLFIENWYHENAYCSIPVGKPLLPDGACDPKSREGGHETAESAVSVRLLSSAKAIHESVVPNPLLPSRKGFKLIPGVRRSSTLWSNSFRLTKDSNRLHFPPEPQNQDRVLPRSRSGLESGAALQGHGLEDFAEVT